MTGITSRPGAGSVRLTGSDERLVFVCGDTFVVALDADAPADVVATLRSRVRETGVTLEQLVALLPIGGEDEVSSFALVVCDPEEATGSQRRVSAVVRGNAVVDVFSLGGSRRLSAAGVQPWLLADFAAVTAVSFATADVPGDSSLEQAGHPLIDAVGRASRLLWTLGNAAGPAAAEDDASAEEGRPIVPLLFGYRLAGAATVPLTGRAVLGRRPSAQRTATGAPTAEGAELVAVASPRGLVSASHLLLAQEGGSVVVTDLHSTNGTTVTAPTGRSVRLRPGESAVVLAGTTVDIGDGNIIEIMPVDIDDARQTTATGKGPA